MVISDILNIDMKKYIWLIVLCMIFIFVGCSSTTNNSTTDDTTTEDDDVLSGINEFTLDYSAFESSYGDASVTVGGEAVTCTDGEYIINVTTSKQTVVVSGYIDGRIVIENGDDLSSYKGVIVQLNNAFIKSDNLIALDYSLSEKTLEIYSINGTTNYIVNTSSTNYDGHAISSSNNAEVVLQPNSSLYLYTVHGHTFKADGDIRVSGGGDMYLSSGHDAVHCHNFGGSGAGTFTIMNAISQGIEASVNAGTGEVAISNGTYVINNCESAMKVDAYITITGGTITGEGVWSDDFVKAEGDSLTLAIADGVSVVIDGTTYTSQVIS